MPRNAGIEVILLVLKALISLGREYVGDGLEVIPAADPRFALNRNHLADTITLQMSKLR
jgi:hypothetical protein